MFSCNRRLPSIAAAYALACVAVPLAHSQSSAVPTTAPLTSETVRVSGTTVSFDLAEIPAGTIELDGEIHEVGPFWAGTTEVTWDLYDIFLFRLDETEGAPTPGADSAGADAVSRPSKPYVPPDRGYGHAGYPAMGMTRLAATRFCEWLSKKTGETYRLPTRAEWVHLAEADAGTPLAATNTASWHEDNGDYTTHPVAKKSPNAWGVFDALGNVGEWVAPSHGERPQDIPVAMGGSFLDPPAACTTRTLSAQKPGWNASDPQIPKSAWWLADCDFVGFRVIRVDGHEAGDDTAPTEGNEE